MQAAPQAGFWQVVYLKELHMSSPTREPARQLQIGRHADALEVLNRRLAEAPADELDAIVSAMERVSRERELAKDLGRRRLLATMNTTADIILSLGATGAGIGIVAVSNSSEKLAFAAFLTGAGMFRVARQFILGYFRIGSGRDDEDKAP